MLTPGKSLSAAGEREGLLGEEQESPEWELSGRAKKSWRSKGLKQGEKGGEWKESAYQTRSIRK